jgi:hypothetical protein
VVRLLAKHTTLAIPRDPPVTRLLVPPSKTVEDSKALGGYSPVLADLCYTWKNGRTV